MAQLPQLDSISLSRRGFLGVGVSTAALGALALAGCAPGTGSVSPSATAQKDVQFTSWIFGSETQAPGLRSVLGGFTSEAGVPIVENTYPYLNYLDQIVLKAGSGNIAGVAHIDEEWMSTLVTAGVLKDLGGVVNADLYPSAVTAGGSLNGTRYAMPWAQSAIGLVSNKALLDAAGVSAEDIATIDGFTDALRAIKKSDSSLIPYAPSTAVAQLKDIVPWMWAFGATLVKDGKVTLGDAGSIKAIEYWKMLLDEGLIQSGVLRDDARTLFAQQRAAIYDDAPQAIGIIPKQATNPDIATSMHPIARPTVSGGAQGNSLVWSQPLVAFTDGLSDVDLLQYMSTDETALQTMFETTGQPPAALVGSEAEWFAGNSFYSEWNELVAADSVTNPFWSFPSASAAQTRFNEEVEKALAGSTTAADAMKTAKADLEDMLAG